MYDLGHSLSGKNKSETIQQQLPMSILFVIIFRMKTSSLSFLDLIRQIQIRIIRMMKYHHIVTLRYGAHVKSLVSMDWVKPFVVWTSVRLFVTEDVSNTFAPFYAY